jgi:Trk-type K+ transport system membrane component
MLDRRYLKARYRAILACVGFVCFLGGLLLLTPLLALPFWPQESNTAPAFVVPGLSMALLGFVAWRLLRSRDMLTLTLTEGSVAVVLSWLMVCVASAIPLMMSAGLDFTQAVFESVSGWTTTGLSVVNLVSASHAIHLWRGIMQFAGGAGLAVILLSAMTGPMGSSVTAAEGRELLVPHVKHSARLVISLYCGYALAGIAAFCVAGMSVFDSIIHALLLLLTCVGIYPTLGKAVRVAVFETVTALTTTGFSTVSYAGWNGFGVITLIVLMLIGGGTCSTAGGIKQFRVYALWKSVVWDLKKALMPSRSIQRRVLLEMGREVHIEDDRLRQIGTFVFFYITLFFLGSAVIMAQGFDLRDSLFEFASALGTVGSTMGLTSPDLPKGVLWTLTTGMFLGRLEIFIVLAGFAKLVKDSAALLGTRTPGRSRQESQPASR